MKFVRGAMIVLGVVLFIVLVVPLLVPVPPLEDTLPAEELADADSQFMDVGGIKVHYKQAGSGEPAIILLHGFGASTFSWREVMEPLGKFGTVVAFDRPAFGLTERPLPGSWKEQNPYSPEAQADLLFELMDNLGIEKAILVGNSAGGTVALDAALRNPERVEGLVLVSPAVYGGGGGPAFLRPLFGTPQMKRLGVLLARSISTRGMDILSSAWHDRSKLTKEIIEGYRKPLQVDNWDVGLWELTRASHPSDLPERVRNLDMPVLVVAGDDDQIIPTENSRRLAGEIPGAELAVFPACGHVPQEECPQAFLEAVAPFIKRLNQ